MHPTAKGNLVVVPGDHHYRPRPSCQSVHDRHEQVHLDIVVVVVIVVVTGVWTTKRERAGGKEGRGGGCGERVK